MPTPEEWRKVLVDRLEERRPAIERLEAYYDGQHDLPEIPGRLKGYAEARQAFMTLSRLGATNFVRLVADAPADRLRVVGFRTGDEPKADAAVWELWQANQLDSDSALVHRSAIAVGNAFALVWPEDGRARVTVEHAAQTIVAYVPGSRRRRAAGLRCWVEEDETERVVLYLPDAVYKWQRRQQGEWSQWQPSTDQSWPITNPLGVVPLVEFRANPSLRPALYGGGESDMAKVLPIQDRINKTIFDRLVTAEFQAFRQRYAIGWTPEDPNEAIRLSVSRLITFEDTDVQVGEFAQADFSPFIRAVEADLKSMAAISRTPVPVFGEVFNVSAETLNIAQSGFVARTEAHSDNFGESWEETLRLALAAEGDPGAADQGSQVIWAGIEHRTLSEIADFAVKMGSLGVPREALWAMLPNVSTQDIERWKVMQADEALFAPAPAE